MNFSIFFIILSSVQIIFCSQSNGTVDGTCDLCSISWFRRKRAQAEYTRWRATDETTEEFIVKVLDEDITTGRSQKVIAVNIQPITRNEKKIIIGGALVPATTTVTTLSSPFDYTRFMPPTTLPYRPDITNAMTMLDGSAIMAPRGLVKSEHQLYPTKYASVKHVHRDESPPSGPQFLSRSKAPLARQYAPVAPVSFNRGPTVAPLVPRSEERFVYKTPNHPTRTPHLPNVMQPSRTTLKTSVRDIFLFDRNYISENQTSVSHTSLSAVRGPQRTLSTSRIKDEDESFGRPTENNFVNWHRNEPESHDADNEDKGTEKKNVNHASKLADIDDDQYELPLRALEIPKRLNESLDDLDESDNSTYFSTYIDEPEDLENITLEHISTQQPIVSRTAATEVTRTLHRRHKQICSMVKLRQLNFNAPRTLPEIIAQLKQWAEASPVAKWEDITNGNYTTMENPIYMMIVDDPSSGQLISAKKTVLVISGGVNMLLNKEIL